MLDPILVEVIKKKVSSAGQPDGVSSQLIGWIEALTIGNTSLQRNEDVMSRFELIFNSIRLSDGADSILETEIEEDDDEQD